MPDVDAQLRDLLDADPPEAVLALPEPTRAELLAIVRDARRRQAAGLAEAFQTTLRHVPFPVRGLVKKIVLG